MLDNQMEHVWLLMTVLKHAQVSLAVAPRFSVSAPVTTLSQLTTSATRIAVRTHQQLLTLALIRFWSPTKMERHSKFLLMMLLKLTVSLNNAVRHLKTARLSPLILEVMDSKDFTEFLVELKTNSENVVALVAMSAKSLLTISTIVAVSNQLRAQGTRSLTRSIVSVKTILSFSTLKVRATTLCT